MDVFSCGNRDKEFSSCLDDLYQLPKVLKRDGSGFGHKRIVFCNTGKSPYHADKPIALEVSKAQKAIGQTIESVNLEGYLS